MLDLPSILTALAVALALGLPLAVVGWFARPKTK